MQFTGSLKTIGWIVVLIYFGVGAVYFVAPSVLVLGSCKQNPFVSSSILPLTWVFWPIGAYNNFDQARRLGLAAGTVWVDRGCPERAHALDARQRDAAHQ